jgi:cellulose synthase operon protein C
MPECEHQARTTAYFDGALPPGDEAAAAEHVATCTVCQGVLGDAVALDAVMSTAKPAAVIPIRRRWPLIVAIAGGLAVAAVATIIVWPRTRPAGQVTIALAPERAIEARFTGERFAPHRPLGVLRGDRRVESISLGDLAKLDEIKSHRDLVAALAATGDLERARTVIAGFPADAASESDRAAVALAVRDHEGALAHAYRAIAQAPLPAAWWNLALAARELGLLRASKAAFAKVAAAAEPGWAEEAHAQIAALDGELAGELGFSAFDKRGRAMVDGGAVIDVADVRRYPAFARVYTLDAIRAASGPRLGELRPLATELDAASGTATITAAIDRAAAVDQAARATVTDRYRAVVARTLTGPDLEKFVDELRAIGPAVDDIRASAIITGGLGRQRNAELHAIVTPWHDPWFDLTVERERIRASFPADDVRAEPALLAALATCTTDAWALRCGQLAHELAERLKNTGRAEAGEPWSRKAIAWYRAAVSPVHLATARALLADIHRSLGRDALARLELEEVGLVEGAGCALQRYATITLGSLASKALDWPRVRTLLDTPVAPAGCSSPGEIQGMATTSDLARHTKDAADRTRALAWIDAVAAGKDPDREQIVLVAKARIGDSTVLRGTAAAMPVATASQQAIRTWGFTTLIAEAGAREAWDEVLAIAHDEQRAISEAPCTLVASFDDGALTIAAKTAAGTVGSQRTVAPDALAGEQLVPAALASTLAACTSIAVVARPPLHGRADILPVALPWWFAGDAPAHPRGTPARSVEVANPRAPDLSLPPLGAVAPSATKFDVSLTGAAATPSRVLAALADATYVELHVHGVAATASDATAFLALSPDADGTFALRADALRAAKLAKSPIVVLAACRAATVAPMFRARWSLPDAFLGAGAHAVVAVDVPIPDASARRVFDELHRRVDAGEAIEAAVAAIRRSARDDLAWASHLMVFR